MAANIIADLMYAQCDVVRNEYLLFQVFIDHRKNGSVLGVEDQKVIVRGVRNPEKVNSWLGHLLQVEGQMHIMGEVIQT